ncbi:UDP-glycosyltransferase 83A1-like [Typha angustifolia]|uniref:UDP-glycosyltransferase 83A1-like n=1 Tax=Typha angustifolia TaxID=59011 RepID=UPI003C2DB607
MVTFVITDFNHDRVVVAALHNKGGDEEEELRGIRRVSVPDGLEPGGDQNNLALLVEGFTTTMAKHFGEVRRENLESEEKKMTWLVADEGMGWSFALAKRMGLRVAAFNSPIAASLGAIMSIPKD